MFSISIAIGDGVMVSLEQGPLKPQPDEVQIDAGQEEAYEGKHEKITGPTFVRPQLRNIALG